MAAILLGDRKLTDLKVTELKAELDKRGLPKKGVKSVLVERLKKAILQEELSNVNVEEDENASELDTSLDTSQVSQDESVLEVEAAPPAVEDGLASAAVDAPDHVTPDHVTPDHVTVGSAAVIVEEPVIEVSDTEEAIVEVSLETDTKTGQELEKPIPCVEPVVEEIETVTMETVASMEEVEGDKLAIDNHQPMDLGSPLDSDPEFDLLLVDRDDSVSEKQEDVSGEQEREKKEEGDVGTAETDAKEDEEEELKTAEETASKEMRVERLDSNFDSSYEPSAEELLYEGDPETETKPEAEQGQEGSPTADADISREDSGGAATEQEALAERREEDEGFMVEVHYKDQGGVLEDPAATGPTQESEKKQASSADGGKPVGESVRLSGCHLWVAGLVSSVRALDLQTLFSSFGQVLSAKVVAKAHSKARFGYVTLATREQAQKCITELNGTELKGSTIHVELAKTAPPLSHPSSDEAKSSTHRGSASSSGLSRGKDGIGKNAADSHHEKEKVGPAITKMSAGGENRGEGAKSGDRKDERRRSSGTSRYHGDDRSSHSRRSRSPPRRSPRGGRLRGRSPPSRSSTGGYGSTSRAQAHSRDARHDIIRREEQRRDLMERRLGADPYYRDGSRQVMMDDRRFADRYQEIAARRQMEMEHTRREEEMARRMQEVREREAREREMRERQLAEQERLFKERERVIREREYRERQRREHLEKELREREQREKELRERERRLREQHIRELQEREMKVAREREMREREVQAQVQRERELREKEQRLLQEHQRIQKEKQLYEEQQRRLREEAERQAREREAHEREARERERKLEAERERERERRLREEKERERRERERAEEERIKLERAAKLERDREQKIKQEELQWEQRDRDQRMIQQQQQQQRLGKRGSYQDSGGFDVPKRQAVHDIRGSGMRSNNDVRGGGGGGGSGGGGGGGGMDMYELSSSVFSRLDPQKQAAAEARVGQLASGIQSMSSMIPGGKTSVTGSSDSYGRRSSSDSGPGGGGGGYRQGAGGYGAGAGMGRDRHHDNISYPVSGIGKSGQVSAGYQKTSGSIGGGVSVVQKSGLSRQNQDIITAALANIQKSVHASPTSASVANSMRMPGSSPIQQISPAGHMSSAGLGDFVSLGNRGQPVGGQMSSMGGVSRQMMGGVSSMQKPVSKLPPVEERYNRRMGRPSHGGGRQANMKRF